MAYSGVVGEFLDFALLLLCPYVSAAIFLLAAVVAVILSIRGFRKEEKGVCISVAFTAIVFGLYTAFNIFDYMRYQRCGLAVSPINQGYYSLLSPPSDLYEPYVEIRLIAGKYCYEQEFRHRYGGPQEVSLKMDKCKKPGNGESGLIEIDAECAVRNADGETKAAESKSFKARYLEPGPHWARVLSYSIDDEASLSGLYKVSVELSEKVDALIERYSEVYLRVGNGTTK